MSEYQFSIENAEENFPELNALYQKHYAEMKERLSANGVHISEYNPRLDEYFKAVRGGWLINYVVRFKDEAVGYSNIYLTSDMHNRDLIATEDTIYLLPEHRNGTGRQFSKYILADLKSRGVKRLSVTAVTDLRVAKLWKRMGFKHVAHAMVYEFQEGS